MPSRPHGVEISVLNDLRGVYADLTGVGVIEVMRIIVDDFDGIPNSKSISIVSAVQEIPCVTNKILLSTSVGSVVFTNKACSPSSFQ